MSAEKIYKNISKIVLSQKQSEGVGAQVRRSIGTAQLKNLDPFLMLDEFHVQKPAGFPDHPHRGFETVTYMIQGTFQHQDFTGRQGTIGPGDLQWMTAGKGIVHAEMPYSDEPCIGLQLWVNLPKHAKMMPPKYQELSSKNVPCATSNGVRVKIIAGESMGVKAQVRTFTPIYYLDVNMDPKQVFEQIISENYTTFIYTLTGTVLVSQDNVSVEAHSTCVFEQKGSILNVKTKDSPAHFVVIAGEPINVFLSSYMINVYFRNQLLNMDHLL